MILNIYDFHDISTRYLIFCTMSKCFRSDVYQYLPYNYLVRGGWGCQQIFGLQLSNCVLLVQFPPETSKVCSKFQNTAIYTILSCTLRNTSNIVILWINCYQMGRVIYKQKVMLSSKIDLKPECPHQ